MQRLGAADTAKAFDILLGGKIPALPPSAEWIVKRELRLTSPRQKGEDVRALQKALIANGYSCGNKGADGDFGSNTDKAVRAFQTAKKLQVDGRAGKNTVTALGGVWA